MTAVDLISQFSPSYHAELALQAGAQALEMLVCSGLIFPSGNRIHSLQHLKAFLELLFSTLNVPKCALMNRSTQILPFGRVHFRVKHMKAWQTSRNQGSPVKMKGKKKYYRTTVCLSQCSRSFAPHRTQQKTEMTRIKLNTLFFSCLSQLSSNYSN